MPKGPKGEKRPADVVGAAVMVAEIATGEIEEPAEYDGKDKAAQALGRKGGTARSVEKQIRAIFAEYIVDFGEHVANKSLDSMLSGLDACGDVLPGSSEREFVVRVYRPSNTDWLKQQLVQWDVHGFLRWEERDVSN